MTSSPKRSAPSEATAATAAAATETMPGSSSEERSKITRFAKKDGIEEVFFGDIRARRPSKRRPAATPVVAPHAEPIHPTSIPRQGESTTPSVPVITAVRPAATAAKAAQVSTIALRKEPILSLQTCTRPANNATSVQPSVRTGPADMLRSPGQHRRLTLPAFQLNDAKRRRHTMIPVGTPKHDAQDSDEENSADEEERNADRENRQAAANGRRSTQITSAARRSSMGLRGKRKSLRGDYHSSPHEDIPIQDYYQHISVDLPEPLRMRQLLIWAFEKQKQRFSEDPSQKRLADVIDELLQRLIHKQINVSWFNHKREAPASVEKKPHPRNIVIEKHIQGLEQARDRLQEEERQWKETQKRFNSMHATGLDAVLTAMDQVEGSILKDLTEEEITSLNASDALKKNCPRSLAPSGSDQTKAKWKEVIRQTKSSIDTAHEAIHVASDFTTEHTAYVDRLFTGLIKTLWPAPMPPALMSASAVEMENDGKPLINDDPINMLRRLANAVVAQQQQQQQPQQQPLDEGIMHVSE